MESANLSATPDPVTSRGAGGVLRRKTTGAPSSAGSTGGGGLLAATGSAPTTLLNGLYDGVLITDLTGHIIHCNLRAEILTGLDYAKLSQMTVQEIAPGLTKEFMGSIHGELAEGRFAVIETYCRRDEGAPIPVEVGVSRVQLSEQGEFCFTLRNIAQRRSTDTLLRTEHQALENLACGIAISDLNGVVLYVNPTFLQIWGHTIVPPVVGQNVEGLWQADFVEHLRHCLLTGEIWTGDMTMSTRAGAPLIVRATVSLNRDQAKHLIGLVLSFIDLTELRLAEESIRRELEGQLNRARSQDEFSGLLNIVSLHDIIQMIRSSRKSGFLEVLDAGEKVLTTIVFADGAIIQAAAGTLTGNDAVRDALRMRGESFRFWHGTLPPADPQIDSSALHLFLDGYRMPDKSEVLTLDVPEL